MVMMLPFFLIVLFSWGGYVNCIEVCDDYEFYVHPDDKHCRDDPDGERNVTEIIRNWPIGATAEEYNIYTQDGYQILLIRAYTDPEGDPVVLGHAAFFTTFAFVNRGNKSIGYQLISAGYDLWIINFRGCPYSRGHKKLKDTDEKYWQFTIDDVGLYDLGDSLEFINQKTGKSSVYIGYGTGSTLAYIYASSKVDQAKTNLKGIIAAGHVAYLDGVKSYLRFILPLVDYFKPLINERLHGEIPISVEPTCQSLFDYYVYEIGKVPIYGDDFSEIDPSYLPILRTQNKQKSVGVNALIQFHQIAKSKKFQAFDYGLAGNQEKYGDPTPPEYNITAIPVPVTLFVGSNDWIGTNENAQRFYVQLSKGSRCGLQIVPCEKWNHNDFLEAKDIDIFFHKFLLSIVHDACVGNCYDTLYGEED